VIPVCDTPCVAQLVCNLVCKLPSQGATGFGVRARATSIQPQSEKGPSSYPMPHGVALSHLVQNFRSRGIRNPWRGWFRSTSVLLKPFWTRPSHVVQLRSIVIEYCSEESGLPSQNLGPDPHRVTSQSSRVRKPSVVTWRASIKVACRNY